jgi:hypothetical protein
MIGRPPNPMTRSLTSDSGSAWRTTANQLSEANTHFPANPNSRRADISTARPLRIDAVLRTFVRYLSGETYHKQTSGPHQRESVRSDIFRVDLDSPTIRIFFGRRARRSFICSREAASCELYLRSLSSSQSWRLASRHEVSYPERAGASDIRCPTRTTAWDPHRLRSAPTPVCNFMIYNVFSA